MVKVSCLCPTYNRVPSHIHLVEEAVESFLRQDYPHKELVILNDTPGQALRFDHPEVRIINAPFRCSSLGDKRNLLAALATGDLLFPWDDDDISLPWRLSRSVAMLGEAGYYNPHTYWFLEPNGLHHQHNMGYAVNASVYRKTAWNAVGGSASISMGEDAAIDVKLRKRKVAPSPRLPLEDWFYIYRWGVSPNHLSGVAGDTFYGKIARRTVESGTFDLLPHWRQDYVAMTRAHLASAGKLPELKFTSRIAPTIEHPLVCRPDSSDGAVFNQIFQNREYASLEDRENVGLILDCGANVGYSTAYFLSRFPGSTVVALEPDPANFEIMKVNLAPFANSVRPMQAAVWSHVSSLRMSESRYRDGLEWSKQVRECRPGEEAQFMGVDVGALLANSGFERISILKMDIEGAEKVVFGANPERWLSRVDCIVIELHDDSCFGNASETFHRAISGQGFDVTTAGERTICKRRSLAPAQHDVMCLSMS